MIPSFFSMSESVRDSMAWPEVTRSLTAAVYWLIPGETEEEREGVRETGGRKGLICSVLLPTKYM